jgi:hypothetical protein
MSLAQAQSTEASSIDTGRSVFIGGGVSIPMVGSWERRAGGLAGYSMWRPEPKLHHFFGDHLDAVWGFYGMYHSGRDGRFDPDPTLAGGFTFGYRKTWADEAGRGFAYQLYWGGIYGSTPSRDLPSELNSTPGMIFSWLRPLGARNMNANLQYMHMSNAGFVSPNRGENFFLLTLEFKLRS